MKDKIPTYSICNLLNDDNSLADIVVYDLNEFIQAHQNLVFPHRHSFYQILYIYKGSGKHIIDFESYPVASGMLYLLAPSQVHTWIFNDGVEGCLINFNENFFSSYLANKNFISDFHFFSGNHKYSVHKLKSENKNMLLPILKSILVEQQSEHESTNEIMRALLLQFILLFAKQNARVSQSFASKHHYTVFRNFEKLIELHFTQLKLPKEYAELLFITPNHLNSLCNEVVGKSAGELIRDRILLEAKRLLINSNYTISQICYKLNFEDNSYFTKFFKKYVHCTPDDFRKNIH